MPYYWKDSENRVYEIVQLEFRIVEGCIRGIVLNIANPNEHVDALVAYFTNTFKVFHIHASSSSIFVDFELQDEDEFVIFED